MTSFLEAGRAVNKPADVSAALAEAKKEQSQGVKDSEGTRFVEINPG